MVRFFRERQVSKVPFSSKTTVFHTLNASHELRAFLWKKYPFQAFFWSRMCTQYCYIWVVTPGIMLTTQSAHPFSLVIGPDSGIFVALFGGLPFLTQNEYFQFVSPYRFRTPGSKGEIVRSVRLRTQYLWCSMTQNLWSSATCWSWVYILDIHSPWTSFHYHFGSDIMRNFKAMLVLCLHECLPATPHLHGSTLMWLAERKRCRHGKALLLCDITTKVQVKWGCREKTRQKSKPNQ